MPLDIYSPKLEIAFEVEDNRDTGASLKNETTVKSSLCRRNHVVLIKLQDEGAENFEDCICVSCNRRDAQSLGDALKEVFWMLKMDTDVDILRDLENIVESYERRKELAGIRGHPEADVWSDKGIIYHE